MVWSTVLLLVVLLPSAVAALLQPVLRNHRSRS